MEFGIKSVNALNYLFDQHSTRLKGLSLNFSMYPGVTYLKRYPLRIRLTYQ